MNEEELERAIRDKGPMGPRITPEHINSMIAGEDYHVFPGTTHTVCCLKLHNGHSVVGESACVSPENFDAEIGRKIARDDARNKLWALEGFRLRASIYEAAAKVPR